MCPQRLGRQASIFLKCSEKKKPVNRTDKNHHHIHGAGVIEKGEKGVLTVPYDEIVIHAGLTEAA